MKVELRLIEGFSDSEEEPRLALMDVEDFNNDEITSTAIRTDLIVEVTSIHSTDPDEKAVRESEFD